MYAWVFECYLQQTSLCACSVYSHRLTVAFVAAETVTVKMVVVVVAETVAAVIALFDYCRWLRRCRCYR